jgi:hypothetical protein
MCSPRRSPRSTASKRGSKARILRRQEAHLDQLEEARVELVAAEGGREALLRLVPGVPLDPLAHRLRRSRHSAARSASPSTSAALASRSHAAQLITEE